MDLFNTYYQYVLDNTEPPVAFHRWSLISAISTLLGRNVHFQLGHKTIYPTMYINLIGAAGTRKTTAMNIAVHLVRNAGYSAIARGKTSKEKFLEDLSKGFVHVKTKNAVKASHEYELNDLLDGLDMSNAAHECYVAPEEFTNFIGAHNFEFAAILGELWDYEGEYEHRIKNGKSTIITNPVISILSGNTPTGLSVAFPPELTGQGFMSRLLLIYSEESGKKFTFPPPADKVLETDIINQFHAIRNSLTGEFSMSAAAKDYLDYVYQKFPNTCDFRFKSYFSRRFIHLLKLCMTVAASNHRMTITYEDALYANTVLAEAEIHMPKALSEYGNIMHAEVQGKVIQLLNAHVQTNPGTPLMLKDIFIELRSYVKNIMEMSGILQALLEGDAIQQHENGFLPKVGDVDKVKDFVSFELLEEYKGIV